MNDLDAKQVGRFPLDKFVEAIPSIYAKYDCRRSVWDVWLHANHHASVIGEEVRKNKPGGQLLVEIADFSMWLFTFLGKLKGDFGVNSQGDIRPEEKFIRVSRSYSDLLWCKYPGMCPVCYWRRTEGGHRDREKNKHFADPCDCLLHDVESRNQDQKKKHVEALRAFATDRKDQKPKSVDEWQQMFADLFEASLRHLDLTDIAFHLLEEVGEVSDAMVRMYTYTASRPLIEEEPKWRQIWLEEEISDVSSWLFALIKKLDFIRETADEYDRWRFKGVVPFAGRSQFLLSEIIWTRYGSDDLKSFFCPTCRKGVCECEIEFCQENGQAVRVRDFYGTGP